MIHTHGESGMGIVFSGHMNILMSKRLWIRPYICRTMPFDQPRITHCYRSVDDFSNHEIPQTLRNETSSSQTYQIPFSFDLDPGENPAAHGN